MRKYFQRKPRVYDEPPPAPPKEYALLEADEIVSGSISRKQGLPGIYFLINGNEVVYVGQTKNLHARIYQHRVETKKAFTRYFLLPCEPAELTPLESRYIAKFKPRYNKSPRYDRSGLSVEKVNGSCQALIGSELTRVRELSK